MANELTSSVSLTYAKSGAVAAVTASKSTDITTGRVIDITQVITTTETQINLVSITSLEEVVIQNLDATNFVLVGHDFWNYTVKVKPGRVALFGSSTNNLWIKANTASCLVRIVAVNS